MTSVNEAVEQLSAELDERPTLLSDVRDPADLRRLSTAELAVLAGEVREFLVEHVSAVGGHLGPNLGAVELTLALHRAFDSPTDPIVFDTGHQAYVHKIVTGRHDQFTTLRQYGGLSGYPSQAESEHDLVENSHASTSLAYADGLAKAFELRGEADRSVVAVIGDGALTGGMCWEALNNIGVSQRPVVIVLNDNGRSYEPTVGVLAEHLTGLRADIPVAGGLTLFDNLGLLYLGPVDGHDIVALERTLVAAKTLARPVLVHVVTEKGKGYAPAEAHDADKMHGIGVIDPMTGTATGSSKPSWTGVFEQEIVKIARRRPDVVGITAAMKFPVGFGRFAAEFPDRVFDVGMAEQHAVTSAAGLAMGGTHPVVAVYATFLNRAFDQMLMDVGLHKLPVTFVLDRAGITGPDGASHHGMWDLSLLSMVPGMRVACPRDARQLRDLLGEAVEVADGPTAIRFPKASVGADLPAVDRVGRADVLFPGGKDILLVAVGTTAPMCLAAAEKLVERGFGVTVVDPRWVLPVEPDLVRYAGHFALTCVVEDGVRAGGVGSAVTQACADAGVRTPVWSFGLPTRFLPSGSPDEVGRDCGLTADGIVARVLGPGKLP